jgi:glycosyltransferase involved in cell wall biosynthesis
MPPPEVSVVCTARNAAATIAWTIESVVVQEFSAWEMVVVDDGSSDETTAIVERFCRQDRRVRLVQTPGVGRAKALNLALREARAPLIANLDADDESHPERLRRQLAAIRAEPGFAVLCTKSTLMRGAARPSWSSPGVGQSTRIVDVTHGLARGNPVNHSSVIMPRALVLSLGGYDEKRHCNLDYDLWVRCAAAGHRIGRLDAALNAKRFHDGQAFERSRRLRYVASSLSIQAQAIHVLGMHRMHWVALVGRGLWGLLPRRLRLAIRPHLSRKSP